MFFEGFVRRPWLKPGLEAGEAPRAADRQQASVRGRLWGFPCLQKTDRVDFVGKSNIKKREKMAKAADHFSKEKWLRG